ncbi:hypothetical protein CEXT_444721 [Caerostris extrusa]|uniref:Uncharacterized protein n=1 Tax=Caerostris extrusa TaxID=172846 RepID=A0AAV4ULQ7_CAEEX|nr:hypothetical protein CEXT_444721 [Caerostris extrusa]
MSNTTLKELITATTKSFQITVGCAVDPEAKALLRQRKMIFSSKYSPELRRAGNLHLWKGSGVKIAVRKRVCQPTAWDDHEYYSSVFMAIQKNVNKC